MRAFALVLLLLVAAPLHAATVTTEEPGPIEFLAGSDIYSTLYSGTFGLGWEWTAQAGATSLADVTRTPTQRELGGTFTIGGTSSTVTFDETVARVDADTLRVNYGFTVNQDAAFNSLFVSDYLPCSAYAGKTIRTYDSSGTLLDEVTFPVTLGGAWIFSRNNVARVEIAPGESAGYTLHFSPGASLMLQDNRQWGAGDFELRLECLGGYAGTTVPAGTTFSRPFTVDFPAPLDYQLDPSAAVSQTDTTGWVPFVMPWDAAPVDVSWLNDGVAGNHGFLHVQDGKFTFADGTPARFWGTCNSAGANFPTHAESEAIAARLAKFGVNLVRTHHADAGWSNPNFFDESYGDTQHFDPVALDNFDYFVSCLKQHGIYVYLDQLVHRKFTPGDGVVNADQLDYAAKPYTLFDPTLIALQKQFSHDLWMHVNPYTGLAYKDDPAIALMDFTNENDVITMDVTVEPYATNFEALWHDWAVAHAVDPNQPVRYVSQRSSDVLRFIDDLQKSYYADMYAYMRSLGVQVPITGNTWLVTPGNLPSQATMDYTDGHSYWDHPTDNYSRWSNRKQVLQDATWGNILDTLAASRLQGKPFVVSEWGHPWPNEWRAEGSLPMAAVGAFQGWDGLLGYTYRHETWTPVDTITGPFNGFNDPAVFGLYPAAALLFRRGDVAEGTNTTTVLWQDATLFASPSLWTWSAPDAYRSLTETTRVVGELYAATGAGPVVAPTDRPATAGPTWMDSDNGQLHRDWAQGVGAINSPRSQAVYGLIGNAGDLVLRDATFSFATPFASVALSSLDGADLDASRHMLLTAVGRAENTGLQYNLTHTKLVSAGTGPILLEPVTGQVTLRNANHNFWIYAHNADGTRRLLSEQHLAAATPLVVDLGASAATMYYEIVASGLFDDIPFDFWAYQHIDACVLAGLVTGYQEDNTYRPKGKVKRDQMAVFLARALCGGEEAVPTGPATPTFTDVATNFWAFRHIEYAVANGVVTGYSSDRTYRPSGVVNRDQMAAFLARARCGGEDHVPTGPAEATFPDVPTDAKFFRHVEYLRAHGITTGYQDGLYHPEYACLRDQMAVFLGRTFLGLP